MSVFEWCLRGTHDDCRREYRRFTIDPKKNTVVWTDEYVKCECSVKHCKCHKEA